MAGVILVCLHLIVQFIVSALVIYGTLNKKRYFLIPWSVQTLISTIHVVTTIRMDCYNEDFQGYFVRKFLYYISFKFGISLNHHGYFFFFEVTTVLQFKFTIFTIIYFQQLSKEEYNSSEPLL